MSRTVPKIATRWLLPAAALVAAGFLCDGLTEVGHHFFLIAGGVALGFGIRNERC